MKVLVLFRTTSVRENSLVTWVSDGFSAAGCTVAQADLDAVLPKSPTGRLVLRRDPAIRELTTQIAGQDLVIVVTGQVIFADGGGPYLRQVAAWAGAAAIPVIAIASQVDISVRELRVIGVEAAYPADSAEAVHRIVTTWS